MTLLSLCELKGIRVFRLPTEIREIDALSFFDDESGSPFIFLNTFKSTKEPASIVHTNLVISLCIRITKKIRVEKDNRVLETEADQFSSEFLMPTDAFLSTAPRYFSLENMIEYKKDLANIPEGY